MKKYYYNEGKSKIGPVSESELVQKIKNQELAHTTLVWCKDFDKWTKIKDVEVFTDFFDSPPPLPNNQFYEVMEIGKKYWKHALGILVLIIFILLYQNKPSAITSPDIGELPPAETDTPINLMDDEVKRQLISENLFFRYPNSAYNIDGDIVVAISNKSKIYTFELTRLGMRSENFGGDRAYHNPSVQVVLKPGERTEVTVPFPRGRKSSGNPYAVLESTEIRK